jgi:REP element-mobilizing transposase RayT
VAVRVERKLWAEDIPLFVRNARSVIDEEEVCVVSKGEESESSPSDLASLERQIHKTARPRPLYTARTACPTHALLFDWTGWLSGRAALPPDTPHVVRRTAGLWKADGLDLREFAAEGDRLQVLFRATPKLSPALFAARVKGRLDRAFRQAGAPVRFSRTLSVRTIGENTRKDVERYVHRQVGKERFADPRFAARMRDYMVVRRSIDLSEPAKTGSGRYWYNLHLVLVVAGRRRLSRDDVLAKIRDTSLRVASKKNHQIAAISVMPDHVHVALRGDISESPEEIALGYQNNLAYALGRYRVWAREYYVGTFSEYDLGAIQSSSPAAQGRRGRG